MLVRSGAWLQEVTAEQALPREGGGKTDPEPEISGGPRQEVSLPNFISIADEI